MATAPIPKHGFSSPAVTGEEYPGAAPVLACRRTREAQETQDEQSYFFDSAKAGSAWSDLSEATRRNQKTK